MPISDYRRTSDLSNKIPIFPLSGVILLPRATLPLNVFEPRYLAMIDHVISNHRLLGIVQPRVTEINPENTNVSSVTLKQIGCVGRVTSFQELDDGRIGISLTGVARFKIVDEQTNTDPFRTFRVSYDDYVDDLIASHGEESVDREHLLDVLKTYLEARSLQADWRAIEAAPTELLVNALSTISPFGPEEKQALLEARSLQHRAEILATLATMEMASDYQSGGSLQ
ncbi:MAG: Lon protease 2 [Hyphomicrobiaceae bacterium hypho_1]